MAWNASDFLPVVDLIENENTTGTVPVVFQAGYFEFVNKSGFFSSPTVSNTLRTTTGSHTSTII